MLVVPGKRGFLIILSLWQNKKYVLGANAVFTTQKSQKLGTNIVSGKKKMITVISDNVFECCFFLHS